MLGGKARADDSDVLGAEGREGAADGVVGGGGFGGEDGELDDGDGGLGVDEGHGDEDAVVPAWRGVSYGGLWWREGSLRTPCVVFLRGDSCFF